MALHQEITTIERAITCRVCGSNNVSKDVFYKDTQYYLCKFCNSKFSGTDCYPKMKYPKELIIKALTYYYNGMSYQNINQTFNDLNQINIPKMTLWRWVVAFSKIANKYVLTLKPELSEVWVADETVIDVWGQHYWFWDIIDSETRFLIASHLSSTRNGKDAEKLFMMAKLRSKTRPKVIITDKLAQYDKAFNRVFYSNLKENRVIHLQSEGFESETNSNLIERFHGTVKQRTKVMRDLKEKTSARIVMDGYMTHYNFFKEHDYLEGITPAQAGGIDEGITTWGDLIRLALDNLKSTPRVRVDWEKVFEVR